MKILEYHEVVADEPQEIHAVRLDRFVEQMDWLRANGYRVVCLSDWVRGKISGAREPIGKVLAITFDDGYQDNYTNALPVLNRMAYPAAIFLTTGSIGGRSEWRTGQLARARLLGWEQVRMMSQLGIAIGSHTVHHIDLTAVDKQQLWQELSESRSEIEQHLGQPAELFSYPYSRSNAIVKKAVESAGYLAACTYLSFDIGSAGADRYDLRRIGILAEDEIEDFAQKVRGLINRRIKWYRSLIRKWLIRTSSSG